MAKPTSVGQVPNSIISFFKESRDELKKVSWPTRQATIRYTVIVVIASLVVGFLTGAIDYLFAKILESIIL